MQENYQQMHKL